MKIKRALITLAVAVIFFLSAFMMTRTAVSKCSNVITKGKSLYEANCFSCHGKQGKIHHIRRESKRSFLKEVLGTNKRSHRKNHDDYDNDNDENHNDYDNDENHNDYDNDENHNDYDNDENHNENHNDYDNDNDENHNDYDNDNDNDENHNDNDNDSDSESSSMPSFKGTLSKKKVKAIYRYLKKPKKACDNGNNGGDGSGNGNGNGNTQSPTYTNDISSIFSTYCTACHSSSSAPKGVRLDTYSDSAANAAAVKKEVNNGTMPPSGALSASLVTTIDNWVANGTPE